MGPSSGLGGLFKGTTWGYRNRTWWGYIYKVLVGRAGSKMGFHTGLLRGKEVTASTGPFALGHQVVLSEEVVLKA